MTLNGQLVTQNCLEYARASVRMTSLSRISRTTVCLINCFDPTLRSLSRPTGITLTIATKHCVDCHPSNNCICGSRL